MTEAPLNGRVTLSTWALAFAFAAAFLLRRTDAEHVYWVAAVALGLLLLAQGRNVQPTRSVPWWLLYAGIGVASITWTDDVSSSWPAVVTTLSTLVVVSYCRHRATSEEVIRALALGAFFDVAASLVFFVIRHDSAITPGDEFIAGDSGGLRGLFTHKNWLALCAGTLLVIVLSNRAHLRTFFGLVAGAAAGTALVLANSKGGLLAAGLALVVVVAQRMLGRRISRQGRRLLYFAGAVLAIPIALDLWSNLQQIAEALNKGKSVGRRLDLWQIVIHYSSQRPIEGWGLRGTWNNTQGVTGKILEQFGRGNFNAFGAHNGYVDTLLQVGLVGLVAVVVMLVLSIRTHLLETDPRSDVWLGLVVFAGFFALSDSFLTVHVGLILIVLGYVYAPRRGQARAESPPILYAAEMGTVALPEQQDELEEEWVPTFDGYPVRLPWPGRDEAASPEGEAARIACG